MVKSDLIKDVENGEGQPIVGAFSVVDHTEHGFKSSGKGLRSSKNGKRGYGHQSEANACTSGTAAKIRQERREKRSAKAPAGALEDTEDTTASNQTGEGRVDISVLRELGQTTNPNSTEVDEATTNPSPPELEGVTNQNPTQESLQDADVLAVATWVHEENNQQNQNEAAAQNTKLLKKMGALLGFCLVIVVVLIVILMSQLMGKESSAGEPDNQSLATSNPTPIGGQEESPAGSGHVSLDEYLASESYSTTTLIFEDKGSNGAIPTQIGLFTSVTRLEFDDNKLAGTIPSEIGLLTSLVVLELDGNELGGTLPSQLGLLTLLQVLHLEQNNLTGTVPTQLGQLKSLEKTKLFSNELEGSIPSQLCDISMKSLRVDMAGCSPEPYVLECNCCKDCAGN